MDTLFERAGDLHQELERILYRTESLANGRGIEYPELVLIADYLAQMRFMLTELKRTRPGGVQEQRIGNFITRFVQIEGRIKELRNDRNPARTRRIVSDNWEGGV